MIVKNGEILAIDHIAHDNTLSGNGTSAKPVGLSQSTKDLIDSKVKKTDFETYKSSAANQISNINTKITTDESNFESYKASAHNEIANFKSSAHDEIARVDASIAAVNAAKVNNTTFEQYQTDVTNNFTAVNKRIDDVNAAKVDNTTFDNFKGSANGELTGIKQSITDLDNAKQAKGDYVSASDFNNLKSSAHDEIERIDGRIDTTNTNLTNNYYTKDEVDTEISKVGAYEYVALDPNTGKPAVDNPSTKIIYLTDSSTPGLCLQWIYTLSNVWKCVGETTVDLDDYAKIVDVNAQFESTSAWANGKFETISDFNTVIAGYYTKGQVDTELENIAQEFVNTSAWANNTFATKTDLAGDKAELEGKINNLDTKVETELSAVSGKIIGELNSSEQALDERIDSVIVDLGNVSSTLENKITDVNNNVDTLTDELHNDYYTSNQIDAILAASGEYYTVDGVNEKLEEYAKSTDLEPIKDDINSISAEFDNYYTKTDADEEFVTKTKFNDLDEKVGLISNDLDTLSGKTVSVIKDSETVKAIPSTEPDGTISYTLSAHDGKQADYLWKPTVNAAGDISWELALTGDTPDPANIKGPQGIQGISGTPGKDGITPKLKIDENDIWNVSYDNEATWTSLGVSATGPKGETGAQGPQGISGTPGKNGENGITPHIGDNNHWFIGDHDTGVSATGPQGPQGEEGDEGEPGFSPTVNAVAITDGEKTGTEITFTYKDAQGQTQTTVYSAWNGVNGEGATVHFNGVDGIKITSVDTTHFNVGLSGDYKTAIESISADYATKDALNDYLTIDDAAESYQPKGNYLSANALNGYATETWVVDKHYLVASDIAGKADKTELETVSGEIVGMIPSLNGYATEQYVQGASAEVTAWVNNQNYLTNSDLTDYATKVYVEAASANAYDKAVAQIPDVTNFITKNVDDLTYYYKKTETSAKEELSAEFVNKVNKPDTSFTNKYLALRTNLDGTVSGWTDILDKVYSRTASDNRYMQNHRDYTLSGDGTTNSPLGLDMTNAYTIDGINGITAVPDATSNKVIVKMTDDAWGYYQHLATSASEWDKISGLSAKSNVNITSAGVTTVTNTSGTTENKFTQYAEVASHPTPRMFLCATADTVADITGVLTAASGMGAVVFVIESHS